MAYQSVGMVLQAEIPANNGYASAVSVSNDGLVMAVGAYNTSSGGGVTVYDMVSSVWVPRGSLLVASDATVGAGFGVSVALSSDGAILAIGAYNRNGGLSGQGGVYVFDRNGTGWTQRGSVLTASNAAINDYFGIALSLSMDGLVLAVGAVGAAVGYGAVYIFDKNGTGWTQKGSTITLTANSVIGQQYGRGVALSGTGLVLVVGTPYRTSGVTTTGSVSVYDKNGTGWTLRSTINHPTNALSSRFGGAVALSSDGNILAISASDNNQGLAGQGAVFNYTLATGVYTYTDVSVATDTAQGDGFGYAVALSYSGLGLFVGANAWEGSVTNQGGVYSYKRLTISGVLTESISVTDFIIRLYEATTGVLLSSTTVQAGAFILFPDNNGAKFLTFHPVQGAKWQSGTVYSLNALVYPTAPATTPYYFKRVSSAGTSGSTEPSWVITAGGLSNDGIHNGCWQMIDGLTDSKILGPVVPS